MFSLGLLYDHGQPTETPLADRLAALSGGRYRLDWIEDWWAKLPWLPWLVAGRITALLGEVNAAARGA